MVNPGAFTGSRKAFLEAQKEVYAEAVANNHVADVVADVQRRYFKRYPITLPHNEEPSDEWLAQVDDNAPDPEIIRPDVDSVSRDDWDNVVLKHDAQMREIRARKDQIKRRLHYQYSKSRDESKAFERGASDPLSILRARLTGMSVKKPRMKTPYNLWGPENRCFVDPVFEQRVKEKDVPSKQQAALRSSIYKEMFDELPRDEQLEWIKRAEEEHQAALKDAEQKFNAPPSTEPEDQQQIIQSLAQFVEPILDLIADHSGWKVTLIAGGPEPADGGRLNMVSIHSGVTSGSVRMNFGRSERRSYKDYIIPSFGNFLKKCYTIEECRARALPVDHSATKLSALGVEEELDVRRFDVDPSHANTTKPYAFKMIEVKRTLDREKRAREIAAKDSHSKSTQSQKENVTTSTVKIGPPKGRKKQVLRTPPSRDAATVLLGPRPAASSTVTQSSAAVESNSSVPADSSTAQEPALLTPPAAPASTVEPSTSHTEVSSNTPPAEADVFAGAGVPGSASHAPTPVPFRAPTPILSRAPTPAVSRAPTPVLSRAPTPALSRAPTPALSRAPTPALSRAPTPALSRAPTAALSLAPTPAASNAPSKTASYATTRTSSQPPTPRAPSSDPARVLSSPIPPAASVHTQVGPPTSSNSYIPCTATATPPGAATVPEFSSATPAAPSTRSRKRKAGAVESKNEDRVSKRTRSSGAAGAEKRKAPVDDKGPTRKKQKADAELSQCAFDVVVPKGCPAWANKAIELVSSVDLGEGWQGLVATWLKFEQQSRFKDSRLGSKGRPEVIADWIQCARPAQFRPNIKNLANYEQDFKGWWARLQPAWRNADSIDGPQKGAGDWAVLRCSGQNGVLSVVAALFFWGSAARGNARAEQAWSAAVGDVLYAFESML